MAQEEKIYGVYMFTDYKMRIEDVVEYDTIYDYYRDVVAVHKSQPNADRNDCYMDDVKVQRISKEHRHYLTDAAWKRGCHPDYPEERQFRLDNHHYWKEIDEAHCKCRYNCQC